jgi:hypothetical protein
MLVRPFNLFGSLDGRVSDCFGLVSEAFDVLERMLALLCSIIHILLITLSMQFLNIRF